MLEDISDSEDKKFAWINIIYSDFGIILAACDYNLLGKKVKYSIKEFEITISKEFYGGRSVSKSELANIMLKADVLNLIGNNVVKLAISLGLINEEAIITFRDETENEVPHAQMYRFII